MLHIHSPRKSILLSKGVNKTMLWLPLMALRLLGACPLVGMEPLVGQGDAHSGTLRRLCMLGALRRLNLIASLMSLKLLQVFLLLL